MHIDRFALVACACSVAFLVACSGSSNGGTASGDGGSDVSADAAGCRTDVEHRPSNAACVSHADAGPMETGCGGTFTPHDDCVVDVDCSGAHGASYVCACQAPSGSGCGAGAIEGNACVAGNCHVDSDCTPCGECRLEQTCGVATGYYCGTPLDECSRNTDCGTGFCLFKNDRWKCDSTIACPG